MLFRHAHQDERHAVLSLYEDAKQDPLCVWNDAYPTMDEIDRDLAAEGLYILEEDHEIIGALSVVPENELDDLPFWSVRENTAEIARIVVKRTHRGKGLSAFMVREIMEELKNNIYFAIHLSACITNLPAVKTYERLGFLTVGKTELWGNIYSLMEKKL